MICLHMNNKFKCINIIERSICCLETNWWKRWKLLTELSSLFLVYVLMSKETKAIFTIRSFSASYVCVFTENSCVKSSPVCPSSKVPQMTLFLVWLPGRKIFSTLQIWWQMKIKKDQFLISAAVVLLQKLPLWLNEEKKKNSGLETCSAKLQAGVSVYFNAPTAKTRYLPRRVMKRNLWFTQTNAK